MYVCVSSHKFAYLCLRKLWKDTKQTSNVGWTDGWGTSVGEPLLYILLHSFSPPAFAPLIFELWQYISYSNEKVN